MAMGTVSAAAAQTTAGTDAKAGTAVAEQPENAGDAKVSAKDVGTSSKASESADSKLAKAPKSSADANSKAPAEPWEPAWGVDVDCTTCHADVETDHKKFGVTSHIEAGLTCVDCHNSEELDAFHGGDAEAKVVYTDELCLDCHIEGNPHPSWEALVELTQDSEVAKGIDGNPVNPHAPHPEGSTADPSPAPCATPCTARAPVSPVATAVTIPTPCRPVPTATTRARGRGVRPAVFHGANPLLFERGTAVLSARAKSRFTCADPAQLNNE